MFDRRIRRFRILLWVVLIPVLFLSPLLFPQMSIVSATSTISRIQSAHGVATGGSSFTLTFSSSPNQYDVLILTVSVAGGYYVTSISETGVTWNSSASISNLAYATDSEIWAGSVGVGANTVVTVNLSHSAAAVANVYEYSGLSLTVDKRASNAGPAPGSTTGDTGTTSTTTAAVELWVGSIAVYVANANSAQSASTNGFTLLDGADNSFGSLPVLHVSNGYLEKIVSSTGTADSSTTIASTANWTGCIATFKGAVVTQPIKISMSGSAASATVTVNGCDPSPSTFSSDSSVHSVTMDLSCSYTLSFTNAGGASRDGFIVNSAFSATSPSESSCSSGTCTELDLTAYLQYDLKIQAADKNSMSNILKTSKAAMNMTVNGGSTTILQADANGYMGFGYLNSSTQIYLTAKYSGTVVNSTWHTTLYTISSASVYQWQFEYNAYITVASFNVPISQGTDNTEWNFTSYYVNSNSSATVSSGTASVYYQNTKYQTCSQAISSSSFTVCTASQSLAGPAASQVYVNMTDGYVWVRSATSQSYGITDVSLTDNVPSSWTQGAVTPVTYSYTNTASAGSTKLAVTNSFVRISLMDSNETTYLFNTTSPFFTGIANSYNSGSVSVTLPSLGAYAIRLFLMQQLSNGTVVVIDHLDSAIQVSGQGGGVGQTTINVPQAVAFQIDQSTQAEIPEVNQTRTLNVTVQVDITNPVQNLVITAASTNVPWVTVTDTFPATYPGTVNNFPLHLYISPGLDVTPQGWQIQILVQGTLDGTILYQGVKYLIVVYPASAATIPNTTWLYQALAYGSLGIAIIVSSFVAIRRKRPRRRH